nr:MAG TPA: hypothetical protein [Caudoviricetes sp.]
MFFEPGGLPLVRFCGTRAESVSFLLFALFALPFPQLLLVDLLFILFIIKHHLDNR